MEPSLVRPVSLKLDVSEHQRLKALAETKHRKPHYLMKEAIRQYLDREEKREALRQEAIRAWNEYRATGRHLTMEEADAWLAKLEAGQDVEPPECHG